MDVQPTGKIAAALAAFQAEMPVVSKGKTATVPTKSGGQYTYTYADLADVSEAALPILSKHELAFTCCPRLTDRGYELVGRVLHSSGETLEGALPLTGSTPQEFGSSLTYMRRYLFGCLTGLVTDDDDDGAAATRSAKRVAARPKPAVQRVETGEQVSPAQLKKIGASMSQHGLTDRDTALAYVRDVVGRTDIQSRNDLTKREASKLIDALEKTTAADPPPMDEPGGYDPWQQEPIS